ncbi:MAG: CAP domain-containing protein [Planctomycetota bacterium]
MIDHLRRSGLVCIALLLVVGCGGGGTDSGSLPDSGQPDGDGSTDAGTGSDPDSGSDTDGGDTGDDTADAGLSAFASEMLAAVNAERADAGEAALAWNPQLTQAATAHAEDMQTNDFFSHTGSDGSAVGDRVHATGHSVPLEKCAWPCALFQGNGMGA